MRDKCSVKQCNQVFLSPKKEREKSENERGGGRKRRIEEET
jgi:hypothetical protein